MGLLDGIFGKDEIKQLQKQLLDKDQEIVRLGSQIAVLNVARITLEEKQSTQEKLIGERDSVIENLKTTLLVKDQKNTTLASNLELLQRSSSEKQERDIEIISTLQSALEEAKNYVDIANKHRDANHLELKTIRDGLDEKDRKYQEREDKLSLMSSSLLLEKQKFQQQAAELHSREQHWKNDVKPQLMRYEAHISLDERRHQIEELQVRLGDLERKLQDQESDLQRRQCTDQALLTRESEIQEWNQLLTSKEQSLNVRTAQVEGTETEISARAIKLEEWARDLRIFQSRVDQLDEETSRVEAGWRKLQVKIDEQQSQHADKLSLIRQQRSELRQEEKRLAQLETILKQREHDVEREQAKIIDIKNKNFALRQDNKALIAQVKLLEESNDEIQGALDALELAHAELKENHQIAPLETSSNKNNALLHPTVLKWLVEKGDPDTAEIENGWIGSTGHGPWDEDSFTSCLMDLSYQFYPLSDYELEYIIVGREGWSASDLRSLISAREGQPLRIYSQEMFIAKLTTGRDPFDAEDKSELLEAFAEDHPALQFLMALPDAWPEIFITTDSRVNVVDPGSYGGVTQSTLNILEYHVGVTSKLSTSARRKILSTCFETSQLPFSQDSDDQYIQQWGRKNSAQRLYRMALHLKILADRQGKEAKMAKAVEDWISDSKWLKEKFFSKYKSSFTWPSI
jgi:hypothetical protein